MQAKRNQARPRIAHHNRPYHDTPWSKSACTCTARDNTGQQHERGRGMRLHYSKRIAWHHMAHHTATLDIMSWSMFSYHNPPQHNMSHHNTTYRITTQHSTSRHITQHHDRSDHARHNTTQHKSQHIALIQITAQRVTVKHVARQYSMDHILT